MFKLKKSIQISLIAISLILISSLKAQTISNHFFGQNAWMPDTIGNVVYSGKLHKQWGNIKNSGAKLIRYGGIATDNNMPTNYQYLRIIDSVRANGMEPTIQVPFSKFKYTAQQVADIVKFINVTSGRNIKYWSIGNEPWLQAKKPNQDSFAIVVEKYFKSISAAMKGIDSTLRMI